MATKKTDTELLKYVLENIQHPERLDRHPWVSRLFVKNASAVHPGLRKVSAGQQLTAALSELFVTTMPSAPPRRGKRLDTRWGEFGILAALYFAPLQFGAPIPGSLRDAWGRIDQSILLYVDGHASPVVSEQQIERYRLVSREREVAPISTLSDWHRKGIQRLTDAVLAYEKYLEKLPGKKRSTNAPLLPSRETLIRRPWLSRKAGLLILTLLLFTFLGLGGYKARQVYRLALPVRDDLAALREAASVADLKTISESGALLSKSRQDYEAFFSEVEPLLWLGPRLAWIPVYGGDLESSRQILQMGDLLFESSETAYAGLQPLLLALDRKPSPAPSQFVLLLNEAQPRLIQARRTFDQALQLRAALNPERLSPRTRVLIEEDLDPLLPLLDDGLATGIALPRLLGAASDGPKTYLLLAQNEDELRPTGGFITAVGTLVVQDGNVLHVSFVDSGGLDNWNYPYPAAPWQLEQYMNSPVLTLRDANWSPDFPTAALSAESLYAYNYSYSVDGVIAFDQHMLVSLLEALGPLPVEGVADPIDAQNVIAFMRAAKSPPAGGPTPADWSRKGFMDRIVRAMLEKIFEGQDISWEKTGSILFQDLDQHHLLLQLDDPALALVAARHGWDGALHYTDGDFVMVADANIGFNKTNAVVDSSLSYDVDLTDLAHPAGTLTVTHHNAASAGVPCIQWGALRPAGEQEYPIDACYWNYMRVYVPDGTQLLEATPQRVPNEWMIFNRGVNAPVDVLDEELDGLQVFGMLMVVPGDGSLITSFHFRLPGHVLATQGEQTTYHLRIKKQPGTLAAPVTVRIHLPNSARLASSLAGIVVDGNHLLLETDLRTDLDLKIRFLAK